MQVPPHYNLGPNMPHRVCTQCTNTGRLLDGPTQDSHVEYYPRRRSLPRIRFQIEFRRSIPVKITLPAISRIVAQAKQTLMKRRE